MVPIALQTTIETELTELITELAVMQPAFFSIYGRYWQGIRTHTTPPADGTKTPPNPEGKPTDQSETWKDLGLTLPEQTEASYSVSAYHSRAGHGYVIHADVIVVGVHHRKSLNVGPDTWRTHTWLTAKVVRMT